MSPDGTVVARGVVAGDDRPDLGTVDEIARMALWAERLGVRLRLSDVAPELGELLALAALPVEVDR